jgi:dethiobiotin synthetase
LFRGVFVTGTDTGVGKTVTAAALIHRYRRTAPLRYWKPVQTGIERDDDTAEVCRLANCCEHELLPEGIRLRNPVSPHLAARQAGITITLSGILGLLPSQADAAWIVEGAGGVLVPLNERDLMIDLMRVLALPLIVVARSSLGTINHTLLTLEALRSRGICVAGVIMAGERNESNRASIESYGKVAVLGELLPLDPLDASGLARWAESELDPEGILLSFLR